LDIGEENKMSDKKSKTAAALKPAIMLFIVFWTITGIVYPLAVYAASQLLFPAQAQGSIIYDKQGLSEGSKLIGQPFSDEKYFWPRPSMTAEYPYNPLASAGSNMGPTNKRLIDDISNRTEQSMEIHGATKIPSDLVTASASGLDPHISVDSAHLQAPRIADARGVRLEEVNRIIDENTERPVFGILGRERTNVLLMNRALDELDEP
jgi:potassium-transporting ATPase KdpC subunit